jgi:MFS family permease
VPDASPTPTVRRPGKSTTLRPVAAAFVCFGTFWGSWSVAVADLEHELHLSHGTFGLLLSGGLAAAGVANALGGALAERQGTDRVLAGSLFVWAALVAGSALVHQPLVLGAFLVITFAAGGLVDTVMNVAATAALAGRPGALVRFHALFNIGGALGAGATGLLILNDASWRWWWAVIAATGLMVAAYCARATLPAGEPGEHAPLGGAFRLLRAEHLIVLAVAFAVGAMVEGGIDLWGVLFLRTHFPSTLAVAVTSAVIAYLIAATARVVLGPIAGRGSAARGVAFGAGAAAAGVLLLAGAPGAWLKGGGLVMAAGGISMCWPLLLAHATAGRERPGAVVGAVTAVGYVGFFAGPTIVGWVASAMDLRAGLVVLAAAAVFVAVAPNVSRSSRRKP